MLLRSALVEGKKVVVGDYVGFKSDIEQSGKIIKIERDIMDNITLILENENGFSGDYIGGNTRHGILASDCWID